MLVIRAPFSSIELPRITTFTSPPVEYTAVEHTPTAPSETEPEVTSSLPENLQPNPCPEATPETATAPNSFTTISQETAPHGDTFTLPASSSLPRLNSHVSPVIKVLVTPKHSYGSPRAQGAGPVFIGVGVMLLGMMLFNLGLTFGLTELGEQVYTVLYIIYMHSIIHISYSLSQVLGQFICIPN